MNQETQKGFIFMATYCEKCQRAAIEVPPTWYDVATQTSDVEGKGALRRWMVEGKEYACACGAKRVHEGPPVELDHGAEIVSSHSMLSTDGATLSRTAWWVLKEILSGLGEEERQYFLHKCGKNGLDRENAKALAEIFEIRISDEEWEGYRWAT